MKISRIASVLFLLAVVTAGGAGCSLGRDTAAGSGNVAEGRSAADRTKEGRVKITVSVWDNANSPQFQAMADAFMEKNPEIDVELLDIQSDEYNNKLTVLLAGNESDPDVIMIKDADTQISMREKGQILDLTSYIFQGWRGFKHLQRRGRPASDGWKAVYASFPAGLVCAVL